ncbi:unnamed protein product [Fusarium graminearum]|uniref:Chromosome 2, complete genome n=1 Tax=Gibberella zeae (strain ATCC MYA-4620 / CBS 123657 / FGSC 9075 / NRRL 31084 / PH-1) TaxID=229533 RepID=A0A1C3YNA4_GIBZE|nr:unnamed protein product [Fusarium graminearum]
MAGKRNRKARRAAQAKPNNRIVWSDNDRLELLAYLNWCVQYGRHFEDTAIDYLRSTTGKDFTQRQIRDKLRREWDKRGLCKKFDDMFSLGTAGLRPLEGENIYLMQILSRMDPPQEARRLRSQSAAIATRSRTLSATRATSQREALAPSSQTSTPKRVPKKPELKRKSNAPFESVRQDPQGHQSEDELAGGENLCDIKSETDSELSSIPSPTSSEIEFKFGANFPDSQEEAISDTPPASTPPSTLARLRKAEVELLKQKGCVATLMNQVSELQNEINELFEIQRTPVAEQMHLRRNISNLKRKLEARDDLLDGFSALETDCLAFANISLKEECYGLNQNVLDTASQICELDPKENLPEPGSEFSELSQSWARRLIGTDMDGLLAYAQEADIPKSELLGCLLAAGFFELVFESDFPDILGIESPLLQEYRRLLATSFEGKLLQKFDLVATKSLLCKSDLRKHLMSEKTSSLCDLVLQSLDSFIPPGVHDIANRLSTDRSPRGLSEEEDKVVTDLENDLSRALSIKLELRLSLRRFKYFFFKPGTPFDPEMMECDLLQSRPPAAELNGLKICLFPALFSIPERTEETQEDMWKHSRASSYGHLTEAKFGELKSLGLITKARVLL